MDIIKITNLTKRYGKKIAINNLSLNVKEGCLFGLVGVNGAGKTTLIKSLCGMCEFQSGDIIINNLDLKNNMNEIREIINISPQESSVCKNLTVKENLMFFKDIYGNSSNEYLDLLIEKFKLNDVINQKAKTLSGGYLKRLSIAISIISKPRILFLDEPTLGLDVFSRKQLWKIISELKGKVTIILTSHYLEEIESLCDEIGIISKGELLFKGTIDEVKRITKKDSFSDAFMEVVERE